MTFHNIGANSPGEASNKWLQTSVPALRKWLKHQRVEVLKMDCEGCEYSIAADILAEDPDFFHAVRQFAVEVHWSRVWVKSTTEMYGFASMLDLLEEAGFQLMHADLTTCGPADQQTGLLPELEPLFPLLFEGSPTHCHNYLFAKV